MWDDTKRMTIRKNTGGRKTALHRTLWNLEYKLRTGLRESRTGRDQCLPPKHGASVHIMEKSIKKAGRERPAHRGENAAKQNGELRTITKGHGDTLEDETS